MVAAAGRNQQNLNATFLTSFPIMFDSVSQYNLANVPLMIGQAS